MIKLLAVLGIVLVVAVGSFEGWELERAGSLSFPLVAFGPVLVLAVVALVRAQRDGTLVDWVGPAWGDFTRGFLGTAVVFAGTWAGLRVLVPAGSPRESWLARAYLQLGHPGVLAAHVTQVALGLIVLAAAQEVVWRGLVTTLLAEARGSRFAWILAAVAASAAELPTMWSLRDPLAGLNPLLPIGALLGGLAWGALTRAFQGRLAPAILSHALFDWVIVMTFRLWGPSL